MISGLLDPFVYAQPSKYLHRNIVGAQVHAVWSSERLL